MVVVKVCGENKVRQNKNGFRVLRMRRKGNHGTNRHE